MAHSNQLLGCYLLEIVVVNVTMCGIFGSEMWEWAEEECFLRGNSEIGTTMSLSFGFCR